MLRFKIEEMSKEEVHAKANAFEKPFPMRECDSTTVPFPVRNFDSSSAAMMLN